MQEAHRQAAAPRPDPERDSDIKALAGVDRNAAFDMLVRRYRSRHDRDIRDINKKDDSDAYSDI